MAKIDKNTDSPRGVRAKKALGQHFLHDQVIARRIAESLTPAESLVLEVGPGTGALTQFLVADSRPFFSLEVDTDSLRYLTEKWPDHSERFLQRDFLKVDFSEFGTQPFVVLGNFPYNISSQILFRVFEQHQRCTEVVGMFQKEVADRVAAGPGSKTYGILSVLLQALYDIEYLFTVKPGSFSPPPKVQSGVIRLRRNGLQQLPCEERRFVQVVKAAFGQRRKTLRNALKGLNLPAAVVDSPLLSQRAEQLSVADFFTLTGPRNG